MNRKDFMRQLERLLQSIPEMERAEALQYYNDYFDDAGVENEKEVIDALGNPAKVAENIKRDLYGEDVVHSGTIKNPPVEYKDTEEQQSSSRTQEKKGFFGRIGDKFNSLPAWGQVLIIIAIILLSPAIIGVATTVLGTVFGIAAGWFTSILGLGSAALTLFVVLFLFFAAGIVCLAEAPVGGVALMGIGLLCGGIGILFLMLAVAMAGIATPAIFRGIGKLWKSIFGKKEVAA